jgi:hypothetical protein
MLAVFGILSANATFNANVGGATSYTGYFMMKQSKDNGFPIHDCISGLDTAERHERTA